MISSVLLTQTTAALIKKRIYKFIALNCRFGINKHISSALYECLFTFELVVQLHNPSSALLEEDHWVGSEELETKIILGLKANIILTWFSGKDKYLSSFSLQLEHNISQVLKEWSVQQLTKRREEIEKEKNIRQMTVSDIKEDTMCKFHKHVKLPWVIG